MSSRAGNGSRPPCSSGLIYHLPVLFSAASKPPFETCPQMMPWVFALSAVMTVTHLLLTVVKHKWTEFSEKNDGIGAISNAAFCIVAPPLPLSLSLPLCFSPFSPSQVWLAWHKLPFSWPYELLCSCVAAAILQCNNTPAELVWSHS